MCMYIYIHMICIYTYVYTWRALHGEATNGSFSSLKNEVQYCCCAAPGMQMPRPTPSKNAQSRMRTGPMQVSGNRAKDVFRMLQKLNCHGSYLHPNGSKVAKQIPGKLQDRPRRGPAKLRIFKRSKQRRKANPV